MKKGGQLMGQPFVMIFAAVVGFLILVWGMWQVYQLMGLSEEIQLKKSMNDFQKVVDEYSYFTKGSSTEHKINLPSEFTKICFYDSDDVWSYTEGDLDKWFIENRGDNVFVFPIDDSAFNIKGLKVKEDESNPLCFKTNEKFLLISQGTHVEVSS